MSEENNVEFVDADAYSLKPDDKISFRLIVLNTLQKIQSYAAVEFVGGYWREVSKIVGNNVITDKVYVPDTREIYSNAIEYLHDILYAHFDKTMKAASETAEKELQEAYDDNTVEKEVEKENPAKKTRTFANDKQKISYRSRRRSICRNLFRELCCFLYRRKYLELGTIED